MVGGGSGEVSGEGLKKHLTIGKADKQRVLVRFGEVLRRVSTETDLVGVAVLIGMVAEAVRDYR